MRDHTHRVEADVALPDGTTRTLWYEADGLELTDSAEPFLAACVLPAMIRGVRITCEGAVSARLLRGIDFLQDVFARWFPGRLHKVTINASQAPRVAHAQGVGVLFSGGVDSFHAVLTRRRELTHLVFVIGADLPLNRPDLGRRVGAALQQAADEISLPMITVRTNVRDAWGEEVRWAQEYFVAALASAMLVLGRHLSTGYIATGEPYDRHVPSAASPLVPAFWSSAATEIVSTGGEASRFEKVAFLRDHRWVLRHLRVCWRNTNDDYNCGRCEKCLRTMVTLHLLGLLAETTSFEQRTVDLNELAWMRLSTDAQVAFMRENLAYADATGADRILRRVLRDVCDQTAYGGPRYWPRRVLSRLARLGARPLLW